MIRFSHSFEEKKTPKELPHVKNVIVKTKAVLGKMVQTFYKQVFKSFYTRKEVWSYELQTSFSYILVQFVLSEGWCFWQKKVLCDRSHIYIHVFITVLVNPLILFVCFFKKQNAQQLLDFKGLHLLS